MQIMLLSSSYDPEGSLWVNIAKRFAEITGAPVRTTYKRYVEGIAFGRAQTQEDVAASSRSWLGPIPTIWRNSFLGRRRNRMSLDLLLRIEAKTTRMDVAGPNGAA